MLAVLCTWGGQARASVDRVYDTSIDTHAMRLWLPGGVAVIRGVIVYVNGAGGDSRGVVNQEVWKEFARTHDFGVLGSQGFGRHATTGEGQLLLDGLARFATLSGQPELEHVPFLMAGFSNGGQYAYEFNAWKPERVIAFDVNKGGFYNTLLPQPASLKTPGILIAGEVDTQTRYDAIKRLFDGNRPRGALWAFVVEEDAAHCECTSNDLLLPFFARAIALRYPPGQSPRYGPVTLTDLTEASGWLANPTSVHPYASYPGDRSTANWLIDQGTAQVFRAFSTMNAPLLLNDQGVSSMGAFATLTVNASAFPNWSRMEFFQGATKLGEVTSGTPSWTGRLSTGTYGLNVLGTDSAGNVRTAKPQALVVRAANASSDLFEAENALLVGALVDNTRGGYSGSGYADFLNNSGDSIEWTVLAPYSGTYLLTFRQALVSGERPLELRVNGQVVNPSLPFPSTGSFNTWGNVTAQAALLAGPNAVRLTTIGYNGPNVDSVHIADAAPPAAPTGLTAAAQASGVVLDWADNVEADLASYSIYRGTSPGFTADASSLLASGVTSSHYTDSSALLAGSYSYKVTATDAARRESAPSAEAATFVQDVYEAESGTVFGAIVGNTHAGYTGTGYVDCVNASGDFIEWAIDAPTTGTYTLTFRYALFSGERPLEVRVNGVVANGGLSFPATGSFNTWATVSMQASLQAGTNTLRTTTVGANGANLDSVTVSR